VYGYEQVNVAAQQADSDSLLNWTRRMIRLRKAHPVFGRGDLRFLTPENAHVLAYVRRGEGEEILVLANLSAAAQTVALDLTAEMGKTPLDLLSEERLAPVTDAPYVLELPPYGYRWLSLQE
jgi:maltose alpha-D-glucosyltransferase/alpha-amylase